ncbi:unnamed protein product [Moneuplotes crassus]|uniref:Uncharacterized protein n=1 Tax=Euplotes crassus TaxID=5936 RepID=A0AAD2DAL8_EUPCR|nr:unnamed protein product [Moneuplotes crassus]
MSKDDCLENWRDVTLDLETSPTKIKRSRGILSDTQLVYKPAMLETCLQEIEVRIKPMNTSVKSKHEHTNPDLHKFCEEFYETYKIEPDLKLSQNTNFPNLRKSKAKIHSKRAKELTKIINLKKTQRMHRTEQQKKLRARTTIGRNTCEQGSSFSLIQDETKDEVLARSPKQSPAFIKTKKVRKFSKFQNSFSLRASQQRKKISTRPKVSPICANEKDMSPNRDYSEEQGPKATHMKLHSCIAINVLAKPDVKAMESPKPVMSTLKKRRANTIEKDKKQHKFASISDTSEAPRYNEAMNVILNPLEQQKYAKLSSEKKLKHIFKIYNRKEMISKVNTLRKNNQRVNLTNLHQDQQDPKRYDNSSSYL